MSSNCQRTSYTDLNQETGKDHLSRTCTDLDDLMNSVVELDKQHSNTSRSRKIAQKIEPLVRFLEQYSSMIDVFVQGSEGVSAMPISIVWGILRGVLIVRALGLTNS